jgi:TonB family protein
VGLTLAEALTLSWLTWDQPSKSGPTVPDSIPQPFLDIVRGCTRFDPAQRCNIRQIRARLADEDSLPSARPNTALAETTPVSPEAAPVVPVLTPVAPYRPSVEEGSTPVPADSPPAAPKSASAASNPSQAAARVEPGEPDSSAELFPRTLFSTIEEENRKRNSWSPVVISVLILLAVAAVFFTRNRWMLPTRHVATKSVPAPAPAPSSQAPSQPSTSPETSQGTQQPAAPTPLPSQAQTAPATEQTTPKSQSTAASEPKTQTAPAMGETTPPPRQSESKPSKAGITEGAIAKRVLPKASLSASRNIRGSVKVAVRVSVNRRGTVSNAAYLSPGAGNYFARISMQAARSWKFKPPTSGGHPESSTWTLHFSYWPTRTEATATELR